MEEEAEEEGGSAEAKRPAVADLRELLGRQPEQRAGLFSASAAGFVPALQLEQQADELLLAVQAQRAVMRAATVLLMRCPAMQQMVVWLERAEFASGFDLTTDNKHVCTCTQRIVFRSCSHGR